MDVYNTIFNIICMGHFFFFRFDVEFFFSVSTKVFLTQITLLYKIPRSVNTNKSHNFLGT